jgi:hypothetical protein
MIAEERSKSWTATDAGSAEGLFIPKKSFAFLAGKDKVHVRVLCLSSFIAMMRPGCSKRTKPQSGQASPRFLPNSWPSKY